MPGGAPIGNTNATKSRLWTLAIERALKKRSLAQKRDALDALAETFLQACDTGEAWAIKELGDRLEGKASQSVEVIQSDKNPTRNLDDAQLIGIIAEHGGGGTVGEADIQDIPRGIH